MTKTEINVLHIMIV